MGKIIRPLVRINPTENIQERIRAVSYFGNFEIDQQNYNVNVIGIDLLISMFAIYLLQYLKRREDISKNVILSKLFRDY